MKLVQYNDHLVNNVDTDGLVLYIGNILSHCSWDCIEVWGGDELTHCGLVTPYGDRDLGQHWLR